MTFNVSIDQLKIGGKTLTPPHTIEDYIIRDENVIVAVGTSRKGGYDDPDFELPEDNRNVLAFDQDAQIHWIIESVSELNDENHCRDLWEVSNHYLARYTSGHVQFDPETGKVSNFLSINEIPIGDQVVELSGEVSRVVEFEDAIFIVCKKSTHDLYAFEGDGTERWRSEADEHRGYFYLENGKLWERTAHNRTTDRLYRFDHATGERLELVEEIDTGYW